MSLDLRSATRETFTPHVGTDFEIVREGAAPVTLRLEAANELASSAHAPRPGFSLVFSAGELQPLPQRIYAFRHPALGSFELFMVPSGPRAGRMHYEVVFG